MKFLKSSLCPILIILGLAFLVFFLYKSNIGPFRHDMLHVGDYPTAQRMQVTVADDIEIRGCMDGNSCNPYKTVNFITSDAPDRVFAFYKNDLAGRLTEDWRTNNSYKEEPEHLIIYGFGHQDRSSPVYIFEIATKQKDNLTYVTVELSYEYGI